MPQSTLLEHCKHGPVKLSVVALALALLGGAPVQAQNDARDQELKALRDTVQGLEKTLQEVRAKLAELEQKDRPGVVTNAAAGPKAIPTPDAAGSNYMVIAGKKIDLPAPTTPIDANDRSPVRDYDSFNDVQHAAARPDNKPLDPTLKGFLPLPGTETMVRFGGSARLDTIYDFENNGNPNQFVPSSIPVGSQSGANGGARSTVETKGTRVSFEARRPAGTEGRLRVYNENDFFDDSTSSSMSFRVRHFYGQAWNLLVGQTYSAFMNIDAFPDVVDYAGPNALINHRQAQVRFSPPIYDNVGKMNLLFSIEQPDSDVNTSATGVPAGAQPVTRMPDGVAGWRWEGDAGLVQVAGLFRSIGYDSGSGPKDDNVFGWGVNGSGAFNVFQADKVSWQVAYGEGMARYVNDLGGENLDAAPDSSGNLKAIPVFATVVGYTHQWSKQFRSTACYGYVNVDPTASLGQYAIENTQYTSLNLVWRPGASFRIGLEYLYGRKETQGGAEGDGHRLNFVFRYDLVH